MNDAKRSLTVALGTAAFVTLIAATSATGASAGGSASSLPPTWHVHDCAAAPCVLPHAPVGFFPAMLGQSLSTYLADPAQCPDATDKGLLGGGQPPTSDGVEPNQPLREGVCVTSSTVIHLKSVSPDQPAPAGWTARGTSGGYATYYRLTAR